MDIYDIGFEVLRSIIGDIAAGTKGRGNNARQLTLWTIDIIRACMRILL